MCFCSYQKQTQPLPNLWQPKEQYLLICTGSENRKGPLEHRALSQMVISSRKNKILSYFIKFRAFYLYVIYHDPFILCVLWTNSDCQVSQGHGWFYKSQFYLWSGRNTENTAGFFCCLFWGLLLIKELLFFYKNASHTDGTMRAKGEYSLGEGNNMMEWLGLHT